MITTGRLLSASSVSTAAEEQSKKETRMFKVDDYSALVEYSANRCTWCGVLNKQCSCQPQFGELQVEFTSDKAYIGAAIGFAFG